MKKLIIIIFQSMTLLATSQPNLDSLETAMAKMTGPDKIHTMVYLAGHYALESIEKSRALVRQAMEESKKLDYQPGVADALMQMGWNYYSLNILDSAIVSFNQSKQIIDENHLGEAWLSHIYDGLGMTYRRLKDYPAAITNLQKAVAIYEKAKHYESNGEALRFMGLTLHEIGDYQHALENALKALEIDEKYCSELAQSSDLLIVSLILMSQQDWDQATHYLKEIDSLAVEPKNHQIHTKWKDYQGRIELARKNYANAISYFNESISHYEALGKTAVEPAYSLAITYLEIGEWEQARKVADKVVQMNQGQSSSNEVFVDNLIPILYLRSGKINEAILGFKNSLLVAREQGYPKRVMETYQLISEAYQKKGDFKSALEFKLRKETLYDSLFSIERTQQLNTLAALFETDKKQKQIELQKAELDAKEATLLLTASKNQQLLITVIGLVVLASLAVAFLIRKSKDNKKLTEQKGLIEKQNGERETLLREIHHRVKNNLQIISSMLSIQARTLKDEAAIKAVKEGQGRIQSMALIHQQLYNNNSLSTINMQNYMEQLSKSIFDTYKPQAAINQQIDSHGVELDIDTAIPIGLILNELITNSLKYAFQNAAKGTLSLNLDKEREIYRLQIHDSGKGLPADIQQAGGMGMRLVKSLVDQIEGSMEMSNENGASFLLTFKAVKVAA